MAVQEQVTARASLLEDLLARLPLEAARVRGEVVRRLAEVQEELATQARRLTGEVERHAETAERRLQAHQLAVLKLHMKLAGMSAAQQEEEWGRLEGEEVRCSLAFLPSTDGPLLGTFHSLGVDQAVVSGVAPAHLKSSYPGNTGVTALATQQAAPRPALVPQGEQEESVGVKEKQDNEEKEKRDIYPGARGGIDEKAGAEGKSGDETKDATATGDGDHGDQQEVAAPRHQGGHQHEGAGGEDRPREGEEHSGQEDVGGGEGVGAVRPPWAVVGAPCLARWREDGAWYRASVILNAAPAHHLVLFTDHGNTVEVGPAELVTGLEEVPEGALVDPIILQEREVVVEQEGAVVAALPWEVGSRCVARWSADQVWYTAEVLGVKEGGMFEVVFPDYGNTAEVAAEDMVASRELVPHGQVIDAFVAEVWGEGRACLALYRQEDIWCRAVVVEHLGQDAYMVEFVDYAGQREEVTVEELVAGVEDLQVGVTIDPLVLGEEEPELLEEGEEDRESSVKAKELIKESVKEKEDATVGEEATEGSCSSEESITNMAAMAVELKKLKIQKQEEEEQKKEELDRKKVLELETKEQLRQKKEESEKKERVEQEERRRLEYLLQEERRKQEEVLRQEEEKKQEKRKKRLILEERRKKEELFRLKEQEEHSRQQELLKRQEELRKEEERRKEELRKDEEPELEEEPEDELESSLTSSSPAATLGAGAACLAVWAEDGVLYNAQVLAWPSAAAADLLFTDYENVERVEAGDIFASYRQVPAARRLPGMVDVHVVADPPSEGRLVARLQWSVTVEAEVAALAVLADGRVAAALPSLHTVAVYGLAGEEQGALAAPLTAPTSLAGLAGGGLAVLDAAGVQVLGQDLALARTIAPRGLADTAGLAQDQGGHLLLINRCPVEGLGARQRSSITEPGHTDVFYLSLATGRIVKRLQLEEVLGEEEATLCSHLVTQPNTLHVGDSGLGRVYTLVGEEGGGLLISDTLGGRLLHLAAAGGVAEVEVEGGTSSPGALALGGGGRLALHCRAAGAIHLYTLHTQD